MVEPNPPQHVRFSRRTAIQAGAIGLLDLGMNHVSGLRALAGPSDAPAAREPKAKAVIYIFLSGGLAQHDSFDMKPDAPDTIRGEFKPIATRTPGLQICEHLPMLAAQRPLGHRAVDASPVPRTLGRPFADALGPLATARRFRQLEAQVERLAGHGGHRRGPVPSAQ